MIEVELPVCNVCERAGKIPKYEGTAKALYFYCTGSAGHRHKRTKMEYRLFREVKDDEQSGESDARTETEARAHD